jgi:hypothetical protein
MTSMSRMAVVGLQGACLSACFLVGLTTAAFADFRWIFNKQPRIELIGMDVVAGDDSTDTQFRATCRTGGRAEIGIGASHDLGSGNGEPVSVEITSGSKRTTLTGRSRKSPNFEMTGGTELRKIVSLKHSLFGTLGNGATIRVSGPQLALEWPPTGLKQKLAAFRKGCAKL